MKHYTVRQVAEFSGVSIRTLHHYDKIGLLVPGQRSEAKYRLYRRDELFRLQQILFYRTLNVPLAQIRAILDDPDFNLADALTHHRAAIEKERERLGSLLSTIDRTVEHLQKGIPMITEKEMYEGFTPEQSVEYRAEAVSRWGSEAVEQSEQRVRSLSKDEWKRMKQKTDALNRRLADLMTSDPASTDVQEAVRAHYESIGFFYTVTEEIYRGLARMYVEDPRFMAYYEKYKPGLAQFLSRAMLIFCDNGMRVKNT